MDVSFRRAAAALPFVLPVVLGLVPDRAARAEDAVEAAKPEAPPAAPGTDPAHAGGRMTAEAIAYAGRVLGSLNAYRAAKGLPAVVLSPALIDLATRHSTRMAERRRPSHDGFAQRFGSTDADLCVENVAHGFRVPEQVLDGWRGVATHHRNLLERRVRYAGIGVSGLYVTFFACDTPR